MKIVQAEIYRYELPLSSPVYRLTGPTTRPGFILKLTEEGGRTGYGEVSPLPGRSREGLKECLAQLVKFCRLLTVEPVPPGIEKLAGGFQPYWDYLPAVLPSVRFGIELALLNLKANVLDVGLARLLHADPAERVPVSGLLQGTNEEVMRQATELVRAKFHSLKLKVGGQSLDKDVQRVLAVSAIVKNKALLRLDANRSWDLKTAIEFGKAVGLEAVEYIEEPLADTGGIEEFYRETLLPVALDETLSSAGIPDIQSLSGVETVVLKPTLLGGIEAAGQMAQRAQGLGLQTVISSSLETGLGLTALAQFAAGLSRHTAAGIDTEKLFRRRLTNDRMDFAGGYYRLPEFTRADERIDFTVLAAVPL